MNIPWTEKYRPKLIDNIYSHDMIIDITKKLIKENKLNNLILYGPPGTGKTTLINCILKEIYGDEYRKHILELNGSDDRGINTVRDEIKTYASYNSIFNDKIKLVILDEVDSMTEDAQYALKEIIELYNKKTKFCLICNFINKIVYSLQSTCIVFRFSALDSINMKQFLLNICDKEKMSFTQNSLDLIILLSEGDLRKACNYLQAIFLAYNKINISNIYNYLNIPTNKEIKQILYNSKNIPLLENFNFLNELIIKKSYSLNNIITFLIDEIVKNNKNITDMNNLIIKLSNIEKNINKFGDLNVQIYSLISLLFIIN